MNYKEPGLGMFGLPNFRYNSVQLSEVTLGRDNNFNLIRMFAALAVLVSHSFPLAIGRGAEDPLARNLGMSLGSIAVDTFFVASGFLVTSSLFTRKNIFKFILARALRIYPALWAMLALTVFVIGAFFTAIPINEYFTSRGTYGYLARCATIITGINYYLPGVFQENPYAGAVNGSLWTLRYEVGMYAILATIWVVCRKITAPDLIRQKAAKLVICILAVSSWAYFMYTSIVLEEIGSQSGLVYMFFIGATFYVGRNCIVLSPQIFVIISALMLLSTINRSVFLVTYSLAICYILIYLAYIPSGVIRKYNLLGDYSYGVYIYAFLVQQSIAALIPNISVVRLMFLSAAVTIVLSAISWHVLERRALRLKLL